MRDLVVRPGLNPVKSTTQVGQVTHLRAETAIPVLI